MSDIKLRITFEFVVAYFNIPFKHLFKCTKENHEHVSQNSHYEVQYSNRDSKKLFKHSYRQERRLFSRLWFSYLFQLQRLFSAE
jgi:hypothetical protein